MDEEDCDEEKVMNFMAMTECANRNTAIRLLQMSNWDEITAANNYFADNAHPPPQQLPRSGDPQRAERLVDDFAFYDGSQYWNEQEKEDEGGGIIEGIGSFFGGIKDKIFGVDGGKYFIKELQNKYPNKKFNGIKFETGTFDEAAIKARDENKPLFVYIHDHTVDECKDVDLKVLTDSLVHSQLKNRFICCGSNINSDDGKIVNQKLDPPFVPYVGLFHVAQDNKLDYCGVLIGEEIKADSLIQALILARDMHLQLSNGRKMPNIPVLNQIADFRPRAGKERVFGSSFNERVNRDHIEAGTSRNHKMTEMVKKPNCDSIEGIDDPDVEEIKASNREEVKETRKPGKREPQISHPPNIAKPHFDRDNYDRQVPLSLKEQQRLEYEEAQIMDLIKIEEMKEKERKEKEDEIKKNLEKEEMSLKIAESRSKLEEEPDSKNPDAATIQIRLADGSKSVTRRFLKTSKIEELYLYIRSLGDEAGFEDQANEFELFQQNTAFGSSNPELKCKIFNNMEATIEEEKLFPRAKIYCREL